MDYESNAGAAARLRVYNQAPKPTPPKPTPPKPAAPKRTSSRKTSSQSKSYAPAAQRRSLSAPRAAAPAPAPARPYTPPPAVQGPALKPPAPFTTPTGQLAAPGGVQFNNGGALPFDPQGADQQLQLERQRQQRMLELQQQAQQDEQEYVLGARSLDDQRKASRREVLNNFAGRGMAFSSGYGNAMTDNENTFAAQFGALLEKLNLDRNALAVGQLGENENYSDQLGMIKQAIARRLAGQAGTLGL